MTYRPPKLSLASRSPRRRELLAEAGYEFEVRPPSPGAEDDGLGEASDLTRSVRSTGAPDGEDPAEMVARLARQKAADIVRHSRPQIDEGIVLGCDTVVECGGLVLGKPADEDDARRMLRSLSGRLHRVLSGLCLWKIPGPAPCVRVAVTTLRMDELTKRQLEEYLAGGQWQGKAGAFGYQDRLGWVHIVEGSPSNVVGLPLELLAEMLQGLCRL